MQAERLRGGLLNMRLLLSCLTRHGFTFNELLVAMNVMVVGVLGLSMAMVAVIRGSKGNDDFTVAINLAHDKLEQLKASDRLTDANHCPGGGEIGINGAGTGGGIFDRCWTIASSALGAQLKQVDVTVSWREPENRQDFYSRALLMRIAGGNRGATLIEQMLALLLGSVMITSLYGFYRAGLYQFIAQETKIAALQDTRGAIDIMIRDLKNAGSWGTGSPPAERGGADDPDGDADAVCNRVYAATATMIHVQMDLNGNGNCADTEPRENIRYEITGPTSTCPGSKIMRRNGDCLLAHVVTPAAGKVFRYFDAAGGELGDAPPLQAIKRISIDLSVQEKNPDPQRGGLLTSNLSTSVELRN